MSIWHFFHLPDSGRADYATREATCYAVELPDNLTWQNGLDFARAHCGIPKGTNRAGVREIQNDQGVIVAADGRKLRATDVFKTWEQLEQEELASDLENN